MSWMAGVGPNRDVDEYGRSKGLPKHWYSNKKEKWIRSREEIKTGNFWDVIDNPLYEVAAGAMGLDWATWTADARTRVPERGSSEEMVRARIPSAGGSYQLIRHHAGRGGTRTEYVRDPDRYELMTRDEAEDEGLSYEVVPTSRWRNKETGEIVSAPTIQQHDRGDFGHSALYQWALRTGIGLWEDEVNMDNWEELRDWGVTDAQITNDLDGMQKWLSDIVNVNADLPDIIQEGPEGWQYGISGDIWEHYGLDKEPEPPKELEWDSYDKHIQLDTAVKSIERYSTPEGITPVDLHGD